MIINGKVLTNQGPVSIENVKVGDMVINLNNRPDEVLTIEEQTAQEILRFKDNPGLLVSKDTVIATRYGKLEGKSVTKPTRACMLYQAEAPCYWDIVTPDKAEQTMKGYVINLKNGHGIFVNGYGICNQEETHAESTVE